MLIINIDEYGDSLTIIATWEEFLDFQNTCEEYDFFINEDSISFIRKFNGYDGNDFLSSNNILHSKDIQGYWIYEEENYLNEVKFYIAWPGSNYEKQLLAAEQDSKLCLFSHDKIQISIDAKEKENE